ncbi:non-discriminatory gln-glu-trna synthetase [Scenedesmus sp. NREL 46B-D3]|nr:non-discriminatory gln-glu-trna synthetase [Scenedesmus sp. NREL 46B-D3]
MVSTLQGRSQIRLALEDGGDTSWWEDAGIDKRRVSDITKLLVAVCGRRLVSVRAAVATDVAEAPATVTSAGSKVKVRFAPSPTGNLHVGGARTALFNWLYARKVGGKFVLRIEDTDTARSTRESEEKMKADLAWLGLTWDEGPDVGGPNGPYRQSERADIYKSYVDKLVAAGHAYPCFCSDAELEAMKAEAEAKKLPPIYRFRVPPNKVRPASRPAAAAAANDVSGSALAAAGVHAAFDTQQAAYREQFLRGVEIGINDIVRGQVTWNTDNLGDFVVLRSNGLPVYNFCVAIDDALMGITHVLRAEEHLPNTLRQLLVYNALGFTPPVFGHMSLILARTRASSASDMGRPAPVNVSPWPVQGYLAPAMVNFLSLLGWNDGTEQEIYTVDELTQAFALDRITKSAAVFDKVKLSWMNGQHLRALPEEELVSRIGEALVAAGVLSDASSAFAAAVSSLVKGSVDMLGDAAGQVPQLLGYPLSETVQSDDFKPIQEDNFLEVAAAVLAAHDSGDLAAAIAGGRDTFKKWINGVGKAQKRKGKRLFMPMRVALTGRMQGPDVGELLAALAQESGSDVVDRSSLVALPQRMETLKAWVASQQQQ